jgi:hypothetical protein
VTGRHAHPDDYCPYCGSDQVGSYRALLGCGNCGSTWRTETKPVEPPSHHVARIPAPRDAVADSDDRYRARRHLDEFEATK